MHYQIDLAAEIEGAGARAVADFESAGDAQWRMRGSDGWRTADHAEHLFISNRRIALRLRRGVAVTPIRPGATNVADQEIPYLFGRETGGPPPGTEPSGSWTAWLPHKAPFAGSITDIADFARAPGIDLRAHGALHPFFGMLDGVQWLLFAIAHMESHRAALYNLLRAPPPSGQ